MAEITHTLTIARPVEEVFARLTDPEGVPEWQESALAVVRDEDGPVGVGSRWTERRKFMGRESDAAVEVTEHEPDRLFTLAIKAGPVAVGIRHALRAVPEGTSLVIDVSGGEGVPRFMRGMAVKAVARQAAKDFTVLKDQLEGDG